MPLRLEIKRKLTARSERVKSVDFHPTEPWLLASLYNGNVYIWNYENQNLVKTFEVTDLPVRASKFISRKSWVVTGSDDMQLRVFNYNTLEKVIAFEAHSDYIRSIAVHPTQPFVLTSSDDMTIKLWDWEKAWRNVLVFEGHTHYVMQVVFNPKDSNTFASASLDKTIKVWSLGSSTPNYTLEGHEKGVNSVDYYHGGDKPYLVSGADDRLVKVWDYQNKTCVQTLEGHGQNVSVVAFHPELPIIITGSEDGSVRLWHSNTYRLENTLNYGLERVWTVAYLKGSNDLAIGYDEGTITIKVGREEPAVSMDSSGKIIWARHNEIRTANIKAGGEDNIKDGEKISLPAKDLGNCEIYPQTLAHSPNGRFVVVCGDGEYIIYTALAWRNKSFGNALEFVWAQDSNEYAIRESPTKVKMFKNFKEKSVPIRSTFSTDAIFGGALLALKGNGFISFFDWETGAPVRRVDVNAKTVYWSESDLVTIATDESFYILRFNRLAYQQYVERNGANALTEEGLESAFEFVNEVPEIVKSGAWVGDCFIYTNNLNRLSYVVGGTTSTISHFDSNMYLLGYIPRDNRVFLSDKDLNVVSYSLPLSVIEYQTAVLRGDLETAERLLPNVPSDHRNRMARFLEGQNLKELALTVSADPEHRFDLAIQLGRLDVALDIARTTDREDKWRVVGDAALQSWKFDLAEEAMKRAKDLEGLLLFYQAKGDKPGLLELSTKAVEEGKNNIAFLCFLLCGELERCVDLLIQTDRVAEAALFARTYLPSHMSRVLKLWKEQLLALGKRKAAEALADPASYENLFPDLKFALAAEAQVKKMRDRGGFGPSTEYPRLKDSLDWDLISAIKASPPLQGQPQTHGVTFGDAEVVGTGAGVRYARVNGFDHDVRKGNLDGDNFTDNMSENLSHLSMEVNTTGTGSSRGDTDFDDFSSEFTHSTAEGEKDEEDLDKSAV
ncbi:Coatomer, beta' subunit [Gonapodya prolifera JEL478]|uniref:Coatomer subunit beta' n=1 Tax=Gonapodya prolifera (strain JEL478) TaxID=1344416 RepID=A0A139A9I4_GONPJ|nr:Coatomer, beta' subunit [Gonapodya prolifera JEL478]|eukprot:KXS13491.1 Coatomer, beta' subunit [Gonapodya prolifera JEL478]